MPATAAATLAVRADPIEVFTARAEARAYLWAEHQISLHQAVDKLQFDAVRDGLVAAIGQDRVQAEMAKAFRAVRQPYIVENVARVPIRSPSRSRSWSRVLARRRAPSMRWSIHCASAARPHWPSATPSAVSESFRPGKCAKSSRG